MQEKIAITEQNIEEMCRLAEDVMQVLYMDYFFYDEEGNDRLLSEFEKEKREAIYNDPCAHLLYHLFRRGDKIEDVRYYSQKEIIPWVEPILHKALMLFRKGTGEYGETNYIVADRVSDNYLVAAFTREVRNMMMIFAGQILTTESNSRYLVIIGHSERPDDDEAYGIYFDNQQLKRAYEEAMLKLERQKMNDEYGIYENYQVSIWEFDPNRENAQGDSGMKEKQYVRKVKIEDLHCFKKA